MIKVVQPYRREACKTCSGSGLANDQQCKLCKGTGIQLIRNQGETTSST